MHFTDYDTRLAAYAVIIDGSRILLSWFNDNGGPHAAWSLPGGGIEYGEQIEDGVVREVFEETGYRVRLSELLTTNCFTVEQAGRRPYKGVRIFFAATIIGGKLGTTEVDGTTDFADWIEISRVADEPHVDIVDLALTTLATPPTRP